MFALFIPMTWKSLLPFQIFNILYSFLVLSACISSLKVLTSFGQHFVTLVFLDLVFFKHLVFFLFYPQISEQSLIAPLISLYHEFLIYSEIVFSNTVITVAFII